MAALAAAIGMVSGMAGLLLSYHAELPSGPCIVLTCGAFYLLSVTVGPRDGLLTRHVHTAHLSR
jgi:zinc/manganese transport system permease protein